MSSYYFFDKIIWSPAGQYYVLPLNTKLMIYNVETAGITYTIENKYKIHSAAFLKVIKMILNTIKCYMQVVRVFVTGTSSLFWFRRRLSTLL